MSGHDLKKKTQKKKKKTHSKKLQGVKVSFILLTISFPRGTTIEGLWFFWEKPV